MKAVPAIGNPVHQPVEANSPAPFGSEATRKATDSGDNRDRIESAMQALRSLREGDRGVAEAASLGRDIVPALKELLFERDSTGFFETRRRAVDALALIGAHEVLIEFLRSSRETADAVERLGEDAIINAAGRALIGVDDPQVFSLFASLARKKILPGVIAALGAFHRAESIPCLIAALAEDESRPSAEAALLDLGAQAHDALVATARRDPRPDYESESRLRQRRSALALIARLGVEPHEWPELREIMQDRDPPLRRLACQLCLAFAPEMQHAEATAILNQLPSAAPRFERIDIRQSPAT